MIQFVDVVKEYSTLLGRKRVIAVWRLNLKIERGEVFTILGPNGAGKTTIIKMICNLVLPTSGAIFIADMNIQRYPRETTKMIGAVLEGNRNIYWRLTPFENCMYFGALKGLETKAAKRRALELIEIFGLIDKKNVECRLLSRGMQQKTAICCALMGDPSILLLDEPALGLDVETTNVLIDIIRNFVTNNRKLIVVTTHNMSFAQKISDRIAILNKKLIKIASVSDLLKYSDESICEISAKGSLSSSIRRLLEPLSMKIIQQDCQFCIQVPMVSKIIYETITVLKENNIVLDKIKELKKDLETVFIEIVKDNEKCKGGSL